MDMPYAEHKVELLALFEEILGNRRRVTGLTSLSLGERHRIIKYFRQKGIKVFNPAVGRHLWRWKKGDPVKEYKPSKTVKENGRPLAVPTSKKPLIGKIGAILADTKRPWSYADGIAKQMFKIQFVEWCSQVQLRKVVAALSIDQRRNYA